MRHLVAAGAALALGALVIVLCLPVTRTPLLRSMGWALVAEDPVMKADAIVVATDARGAGLLEAADLVKAGVAERVILFAVTRNKAGLELVRRGVSVDDVSTLAQSVLERLGVVSVDIIPRSVVGTNDEGWVLQRWCPEHGIHSVVFISNIDHSRRTRRVMARSAGNSGVKVMVRYARFSEFDPDTWWQTRGGQRTEIEEAEKLLLDLVAHPFS